MEGNDFVSEDKLKYEGPVNWCLLWGDAYHSACYRRSGWVPLASTTWCIYDWNQFSKWNIYVTNFSEVVRVHEFAGCRSSMFWWLGWNNSELLHSKMANLYLWKIKLIYELIGANMYVCQLLAVCGQQPFRQRSTNTLRWTAQAGTQNLNTTVVFTSIFYELHSKMWGGQIISALQKCSDLQIIFVPLSSPRSLTWKMGVKTEVLHFYFCSV